MFFSFHNFRELVPTLISYFPQICIFCPKGMCESESESLGRVGLFETQWTAAYQAPPSMGFSRQAYWSGLPFPSPGDLPDTDMETEHHRHA